VILLADNSIRPGILKERIELEAALPPSSVADNSIRPGILKARAAATQAMLSISCRQLDPTGDTESSLCSLLGEVLVHVADNSIRPGILKGMNEVGV